MLVKNNFTLLFVFFFFTNWIVAQLPGEKWIKGIVSSNGIPLEGINIVNDASHETVMSDAKGAFTVLVKSGDILNISAINYELLRKFISTQEYNSGSITVDLTQKSIELKEVVVGGHPEISAENLGIIPHGQVKLTPAERRLQAAGDFKPIHLLGLLGGALAVDPILNAINGRTKMLKKELVVEKKEFLLAKMESLFEDEYYIKTLKIGEEYIKGFQYYCVEDKDFVRSLNEKNKTMSMFLIVGLASNFNKEMGAVVKK